MDVRVKEGWAPKNWCFWSVVLEKTLESPLDIKKIKPVNPKYSLEGLMLKLELQHFGHLMRRADLDPDAGKDWGREEKGMTEDEILRWHYRLNGHEFEQALGDGEEQGNLACCNAWGRRELDTTERLNNNSEIHTYTYMWCYVFLSFQQFHYDTYRHEFLGLPFWGLAEMFESRGLCHSSYFGSFQSLFLPLSHSFSSLYETPMIDFLGLWGSFHFLKKVFFSLLPKLDNLYWSTFKFTYWLLCHCYSALELI